MATIKAYSVAKTEKGFGSAVSASTVYSISPLTVDAGGSQAYLHGDHAGMQEGRTKTLLKQDQTAVNHDVTACAITTAGSGGPASSAVICSTTNLTGTGKGAGLIVRFTTNASGGVNGTVTIVDGGEGYASNETVSVDGIAGSVLTLTAA